MRKDGASCTREVSLCLGMNTKIIILGAQFRWALDVEVFLCLLLFPKWNGDKRSVAVNEKSKGDGSLGRMYIKFSRKMSEYIGLGNTAWLSSNIKSPLIMNLKLDQLAGQCLSPDTFSSGWCWLSSWTAGLTRNVVQTHKYKKERRWGVGLSKLNKAEIMVMNDKSQLC